MNAVEEGLLNANHEALGFKPTTDTQTPVSTEDGNANTAARTEIEAGIVQLESLLNATIDKNFDKLEIYTLRNLLTVSNRKEDEGLEDWILLDHYKDLGQHTATEQEGLQTSSPESVQFLRRKVQETEKLQAVLKAEAAKNEAILYRLRPLVPRMTSSSSSQLQVDSQEQSQKSLAFLTETPAAATLGISTKGTLQPLAQNTRFTVSQLPALKELLEGLRPSISSVPVAGRDQAAETREAYIESQSRKAMVKRGIDADAAAGAITEGLGRPLGNEEVRALEGIVGSLGDGRDTRSYEKMEE